MLLEHTGKPADAVPLYHRALKLNPNAGEYHNNLGVALAAQGKQRRGRTVLPRSLRITPNSALGHSNLGNALRALDRLDEAEQLLRRARDPTEVPRPHNLGIVLMNQGRLDEASPSTTRPLPYARSIPTPT